MQDNGKTARVSTLKRPSQKGTDSTTFTGWFFCIHNNSMQATKKQRLFVAGIIDKLRDYHKAFQEVMESTPRNNDNYPDTRADYRILILAERMKSLTRGQAEYIIKAYRGFQGFSIIKARNIITSMF